jgi:hypothetical protein
MGWPIAFRFYNATDSKLWSLASPLPEELDPIDEERIEQYYAKRRPEVELIILLSKPDGPSGVILLTARQT